MTSVLDVSKLHTLHATINRLCIWPHGVFILLPMILGSRPDQRYARPLDR